MFLLDQALARQVGQRIAPQNAFGMDMKSAIAAAVGSYRALVLRQRTGARAAAITCGQQTERRRHRARAEKPRGGTRSAPQAEIANSSRPGRSSNISRRALSRAVFG